MEVQAIENCFRKKIFMYIIINIYIYKTALIYIYIYEQEKKNLLKKKYI